MSSLLVLLLALGASVLAVPMPMPMPMPDPAALALALAQPKPLPLPLPQSSGGSSGSSKCTASRLASWRSSTLEPCFDRAHESLDTSGVDTRGELWQFLCARAGGRIKCVEDFGDTCYNSEESNNVMINVLSLEFERAINDTVDLGQSYIAACSLLSRNEDVIVRAASGSNRCSMFQYLRGRQAARQCFSSNVAALNRAIDAAPRNPTDAATRTLFTAVCNFVSNLDGRCTNEVAGCLGSESLRALRSSNQDDINDLNNAFGNNFNVRQFCSNFGK